MRNRVLDTPRHSYVPASSSWTLLIFKESLFNSILSPDLILTPVLPLYHEIFWPSVVSSFEHFTVSVLPRSQTWCFFSSTLLFSEEKNIVSQIRYQSNVMNQRRDLMQITRIMSITMISRQQFSKLYWFLFNSSSNYCSGRRAAFLV